jgi:predicted metal-dependent TIM-barrel fold hydrolase
MSEAEEGYFRQQVELARAFELPLLVHTPHRDKKRGTEFTISVIRDMGFPEERVLIDHNNEETLPVVLETKCWAGHTIYPQTKMDEQRMVALVKKYGPERLLVNSSADWGVSDALKVPKTVAVMREHGISETAIEKIVWDNPIEFFSQSGRLDLARPKIDQSQLFEGNSVLRGQPPQIET